MIQAQDLQFTLSESEELAAASRTPVDASTARRFHHDVGGWAAPLRLLIGAAGAGQPTEGVVENWLDHFVIASSRTAHTVESLLLLSLAERLDQELVDDLAAADPTISRFAVDLIERPGLLERRQRSGRTVYEFPPVILRHLRARMGRDREKARSFHRRLAEWYASRADSADAACSFWHAVAAADYEFAHDIWAENSPRMTMAHPELYRRSLEALPPAVLHRFPGMQVALAATRATAEDTDPIGRDTTFRAMAAAAERILTRGSDLPLPDLLSVGAGRIIGLRRHGSIERATAYAAELSERVQLLLRRVPVVPSGLFAWFNLQHAVTATVAGD